MSCPWLSDGQWQVHWTKYSSVQTARQSLLCVIASGADSAVDIINLVQQSPTDILIQWVSGHCGRPGNELADQRAKQAAASKDDPPSPITLCNVVTAVKQLIRDTAPTHGRTKAAYDQYSERRDSAEIQTERMPSWWHNFALVTVTYYGHTNTSSTLWSIRHARSVAEARIPWNTGSSNVLHWQLPGYISLGPQMYL